MVGSGTFTGTRHTAKAQAGTMYETVKMWIRAGGRYIDAASNYLNEVMAVPAGRPRKNLPGSMCSVGWHGARENQNNEE